MRVSESMHTVIRTMLMVKAGLGLVGIKDMEEDDEKADFSTRAGAVREERAESVY